MINHVEAVLKEDFEAKQSTNEVIQILDTITENEAETILEKELDKEEEDDFESFKKFRDETNLRAKAEAELKVKESMIETLREVLALQKSSIQQAGVARPASPRFHGGQGQDQGPEVCRDFSRQGHCFRGSSCKYFHPPGRHQSSTQPDISQRPDCRYWLEGYCRKAENLCWGKHNPSLCGTQQKQPPQMNGNSFQNQNFVESLAKAVSQSLVGAQQAATAPSRGQPHVGLQPAQQQHMMNNQIQQNMMMNQQEQIQQAESAPSRGQTQVGLQPTQQQQILNNHMQQNTMMNQQQQNMVPMMMIPSSQSLYFPAQQGRQGPGQ